MVLGILNKFKKVDRQKKELAVAELTNFLVRNFNFSLEDAFKASSDFWKKHEDKLRDVI
jgi:hypothetical protein